MTSLGNSEIGKGHYIKYNGKTLSYRVWYDKSNAMLANQMGGCWKAIEKDCKDLVEKEKKSESLAEDGKKLLSKKKKAVEYLILSLEKAHTKLLFCLEIKIYLYLKSKIWQSHFLNSHILLKLR